MIQVGQIYQTEDITFEVVKIIPVTKYVSKIEVKLNGAGLFSRIDAESGELEEAIATGKAFLLSDE